MMADYTYAIRTSSFQTTFTCPLLFDIRWWSKTFHSFIILNFRLVNLIAQLLSSDHFALNANCLVSMLVVLYGMLCLFVKHQQFYKAYNILDSSLVIRVCANCLISMLVVLYGMLCLSLNTNSSTKPTTFSTLVLSFMCVRLYTYAYLSLSLHVCTYVCSSIRVVLSVLVVHIRRWVICRNDERLLLKWPIWPRHYMKIT